MKTNFPSMTLPHQNLQLPEQHTSPSSKEHKRTGDEFEKKFYGHIPLPHVSDTQVNNEKETAEKPYTDKERRQLKHTVNTYSPVLKHD